MSINKHHWFGRSLVFLFLFYILLLLVLFISGLIKKSESNVNSVSFGDRSSLVDFVVYLRYWNRYFKKNIYFGREFSLIIR